MSVRSLHPAARRGGPSRELHGSELHGSELHGSELHGRVRDALVRSPHFSTRRVGVRVDRGDVVLTGSVTSWYHKQVAQEAVRRVTGVEGVRNELCVAR